MIDGMEVQGFADARFALVRECFADVLGGQAGTGAAFAAWCDGRRVVDLWGGHADRARTGPWQREQARAVDLTCLDDAFRAANAAGRPTLYRQAIANPPGAQDPGVVNGARWRAADIPAINGHGTARAVADFYQALAAGRLLGPGMLAEAITPQARGRDRVFGGDNAWGLGFGIDGDGYGMGGLGGSYGGTSTAGGYTIGFVTGTVGSHDRIDALENALRDCLGLPAVS